MSVHFVIVGNGIAGTSAAFAIRRREPKARITLIGGESDYFFSRTALMYAFMDRMNLRDLEPYERKVYDAQKIERVRGWVTDLDDGARRLRLYNGTEIAYDRLLLATGSVPASAPWPGLDRCVDGVVNFVSLQDLERCERLTPTTKQAVVVGGGLIGVELVECLSFHNLQVTFLAKDKWYWPAALGPDEGMLIADHIRRHGVDLRLGEEVSEVLADDLGRVRGVRVSQAQYPCQMLGISIGVRPAISWLEKVTTPPALGRGIRITADFRTSLTNVWSAGDCAELLQEDGSPIVEQIWYSAKRQGELAGDAMLGDPISYRPPLFYNSAKFFDIEYTTVGKVVRLPEQARSFSCRIPGRDVNVRIIEHEGAVIGFNMLGSRWNHALFEDWINERRTLEYVIDHLQLAQFDVEFGRTDLAYVRTQFAQRRSAGATA
jgi:NADPH-dependent 2,4-dienoyl-CoA reductase/sulfur reductase-like enzyme